MSDKKSTSTDRPTTMAVGEEEGGPTTMAVGEEEGSAPTTMATGEEGPGPTTMAVGEEEERYATARDETPDRKSPFGSY